MWSDDVEVEEVTSGENVKFKLKVRNWSPYNQECHSIRSFEGIDENEILSGFCLCSNDSLCKIGRIFDAQVSDRM